MPVQRALTYTFLAALILLQYPLWLGKGGWLRVWELDRQVGVQKQTTEGLKRRNAGLDAEVRDLKNGVGAVEERARYELGMVKDDELFFQVLDSSAPPPTTGAAAPVVPPPAVPGSPPGAATAGATTASAPPR